MTAGGRLYLALLRTEASGKKIRPHRILSSRSFVPPLKLLSYFVRRTLLTSRHQSNESSYKNSMTCGYSLSQHSPCGSTDWRPVVKHMFYTCAPSRTNGFAVGPTTGLYLCVQLRNYLDRLSLSAFFDTNNETRSDKMNVKWTRFLSFFGKDAVVLFVAR